MRKKKRLSNFIKIMAVTEQPSESNSYPLKKVTHLMKQIVNDDREDGCLFYLYNERLYETETKAEEIKSDYEIVIMNIDLQPDEDLYWSYPLEEIPYIMDQIKDGDRENGYLFYLYDGYLYENEETIIL